MVRLVTFGAWLGAAVLAASYLGAIHPIGDSFAVFRPQIAVGTLLLAVLVVRRTWAAAVPGTLALVALLLLSLPRLNPQTPGPITVYQKNMLWRNADVAALEADIREAAPDVLFLQELTDPNYVMVERLRDILPNEFYCWPGQAEPDDARVGGSVIVTRFEIVENSLVCTSNTVGGRVRTPSGEVSVASVHLRWPWPYGQAAHVERMLAGLAGLERPVILAGDLNSAPWSDAAARIGAAIGAEPILPAIPSFPLLPLVTVPIDHVFASSGTLERRPLAGADHHGILARVTP